MPTHHELPISCCCDYCECCDGSCDFSPADTYSPSPPQLLESLDFEARSSIFLKALPAFLKAIKTT